MLAGPQVGQDHPALGFPRCDRRQLGEQVRIRQPMESKPSNAGAIVLARNRQQLGQTRQVSKKDGVETGYV